MSEKLISNITQVTYEVNSYNFMLNDDGVRTVYDIYPNGHIIAVTHSGEEEESETDLRVDPAVVSDLFRSLANLLQNAESVHHYIDEQTALLTIHLNGGDITLPRGLSTDSVSLNRIMSDFIKEQFQN